MLIYLKKNYKFFLILLMWVAVGKIMSLATLIVVPTSILYLKKREQFTELLLGFLFILVISDNRTGNFSFAISIRPIYLIMLTYFLYSDAPKFKSPDLFFKPFLLFFLIALLCIPYSNSLFMSTQKTLSYFLMVLVIPNYINLILKENKEENLKGIIYLCSYILIIGLILRVIAPSLVIYGGILFVRYSGMFGNPNGLGIFVLLSYIIFSVIDNYYPNLIKIREKWIIRAVMLISLVFCASRGAMLALGTYFIFEQISKKSVPLAVIFTVFAIASYKILMLYLEDIIISLDLQAYFRLQTIKTGSGRVVAYEFAWENIKRNYLLGRGFGFAEELFHRPDIIIRLNALNHQGGTHNTYLTIWLDTGFLGLIMFVLAWVVNILRTAKHSHFAYPILISIVISSSVESWLASSINAFTVWLIIILSLLNNDNFYVDKNKKRKHENKKSIISIF